MVLESGDYESPDGQRLTAIALGRTSTKKYLTRNEQGQIDTQSEGAQADEIARDRYDLSVGALDEAVSEYKADDGGRLAALKRVILG